MLVERKVNAPAGLPLLLLFLAVIGGAIWRIVVLFRAADQPPSWEWFVALVLTILLCVLGIAGLFTVAPNESRVLQLFGAYRGTVAEAGLRWANPFYSKTPLSVRTRNFETSKLKVNDRHGNPIEIGAVVVWKVVDTAEALFNVDDYEDYVRVQSESALRNLATGYPYDSHGEAEISLSGDTAKVSEHLRGEVQERLARAGVNVIESRISHLAYAQEIAAAMLQRQQASAVVAARSKIVEGAVGMVEHALELLAKKNVVDLDPERRAAMVSNLLVVLCSDRHTQPVVNTGTLHS